MLSKNDLTNKIAVETSDGFERWKIAAKYFKMRAAEFGKQSLIPQHPYCSEEMMRLLGDIVRIQSVNNRSFLLVNAHDSNYWLESDPKIPKDKQYHISSLLTERGMDYEIDELSISISWHDQALEKAFDLFKLWMIDRIGKEKMEKILEDSEETFDL